MAAVKNGSGRFSRSFDDQDDCDLVQKGQGSTAWQMGYDDFNKGVRRNDNPFSSKTDSAGKEKFKDWADGWMAAQSKTKGKSFSGFLKAIASRRPDLVEEQGGRYVTFEKSSINETSGAGGGYLVPVEYTTKLLFSLNERSLIYPRAFVVPMGSSEVRGPMLDATTVQAAGTAPFFGGLLYKWGTDGRFIFSNDETEPQFRELTLRAWDLLGFAGITNQMLADMGPEGESRLLDTLGQAAAWYAEYAFFNGYGAGASMPLGILNAPCAIDVARAGASHIIQADVATMISKLLPSCWMRAIWCCSVTALTDVVKLTGYQANIARRDENDPCVGYLENRPLFVTDKLPALGTRGDLTLFDPSLYVIGDRMQVVVDVGDQTPTLFQSNRSMFRTWLRLDGKMMLNGPVTLPDVAQTVVSAVVVLADH